MRFYEIYHPDLNMVIKFKILSIQEGQRFCLDHEDESAEAFKDSVINILVDNYLTEVVPSTRSLNATDKAKVTKILYNGALMLNPSVNFENWITISREESFSTAVALTEEKPARTKAKSTKATKRAPKEASIDQTHVGLKRHLEANVVGQPEAIEEVCSVLKRSQAGLRDEDRPLGVFLFAGSSGVGKTRLPQVLHEHLFGDEYELVRIDCGEFQQKHENQKLIGAPNGYERSEEGGQLTNAILAHPKTVVLIDEIEKAHPHIFDTFLRICDEGIATDGLGNKVSFKETIIFFTTNIGNDVSIRNETGKGLGFNTDLYKSSDDMAIPKRDAYVRLVKEELKKRFRPEFLNRIDSHIVFNHLTKKDCKAIAEIELHIVQEKLSKRGYSLIYDEDVTNYLVENGFSPLQGARMLSQLRRKSIEDPLADILLSKVFIKGSIFQLILDSGDKLAIKVMAPEKGSINVR